MKVLIKETLSKHKFKDLNGYLICTDCVLARTGKQSYRKNEVFATDDISEIEIDRPYEEVFDAKTLASFENVPLCKDHPDEDVTPENHNSYSVGFVRNIRQGKDNNTDVIIGDLVITDSDVIELVENGEYCELSCGYNTDIIGDDREGYKQTNIRGNHVALCQQGRAGNARIVDSKLKLNYSKLDLFQEDNLKSKFSNYHVKFSYNRNGDNYILDGKKEDIIRAIKNIFGSDTSNLKFDDSVKDAQKDLYYNTIKDTNAAPRGVKLPIGKTIYIPSAYASHGATLKERKILGYVDKSNASEHGYKEGDFEWRYFQRGDFFYIINDLGQDVTPKHEYVIWNNSPIYLEPGIYDSVKDAQDYTINFRNDYEGFREKIFIKANSAIEALKEFSKNVILKGWGTRNITIISVSPNDGNMRLYGNLYDLIKSTNDSVKDTEYKIVNYNNKWYYEIKQDDGFTKLVGPYLSEKEAREYFMKHRPNEKLKDSILGKHVIIRPRDVRMNKYVDERGIVHSYEGTNADDIVEVKLNNGQYVEVRYDEIRFLDASCKDELYSLRELNEMRIGSYKESDIYKVDGKYSTNPNTSRERFNSLEEVKKYIDNKYSRDSLSSTNEEVTRSLENNLKNYEVKNLSSVKPLIFSDNIKDANKNITDIINYFKVWGYPSRSELQQVVDFYRLTKSDMQTMNIAFNNHYSNNDLNKLTYYDSIKDNYLLKDDGQVVAKYFDNNSGKTIYIVKYPNGKYYNEYGPHMFAGSYESLEEAERYLLKHSPSSVKIKDKVSDETIKLYQAEVDYQLEHFGRIGGGLYGELDDNGLYVDNNNIVKRKVNDSIKDSKPDLIKLFDISKKIVLNKKEVK